MMYKSLKWIRVVLSLVLFLIVTLNFLYFANEESHLLSQFLKFQFVPSLLGLFTGSAIFFVILIILTLLFGRVYCSTLCPVGTFQDMVSRFSSIFKSKKSRRFKYAGAHNILRYSILTIVLLPLIFGITLPIALLDPYSNWGRISSQILGKGEQVVTNFLSTIFPDSIFFRSYTYFAIGAFILATLFLLVLIVFSALKGRLYCNTICPVGTMLGGLSRFSLFKPTINENCNHCMLCISNCKSQCIDVKNGIVDTSRCVACLNCMQSCKKGAITYTFTFKRSKSTDKVVDQQGRRRALIALGLLGGAVVARAAEIGPIVSSKPKSTGIAPPGALGIDNLKAHCTTCHACISVCPGNIIKPATLEYGLDGFMMPVLHYKDQFCTYECNRCSQVCPNGALIPLSLEEKKVCQIGKAKFSLKDCIVYKDKTDCGACDEHCPTNAITMIPYRDTALFIPKLDRDVCIGCGACEYICPATPVKAMVVSGNEEHKIATEAVKEEKKDIKVDEFGF